MALAVLRHERDAVRNRVGGCPHVHRVAAEEDAPAVERIRPEDRARRFGSLRSDEPRDAEDLAAPHAETDAVKHALSREPLDAQQFLARFDRDLRELVMQIAADHQADHLVDGGRCDRHGRRRRRRRAGSSPGRQSPSPRPADARRRRWRRPGRLRRSIASKSRSISCDVSVAVGSSMTISLASSDSAFAISTICCCATPRCLTVASGSICRSSEVSTSRVRPDQRCAIDDGERCANAERLAAEEDVLGHGHVAGERELLVDRADAERLRVVRATGWTPAGRRCGSRRHLPGARRRWS